jgi:hypothetical protein
MDPLTDVLVAIEAIMHFQSNKNNYFKNSERQKKNE